MTGTTIAQAIPIGLTPILARIYTPDDFGVFAVYYGIVSMLAVVITGRYEMAIMLPHEEEDAFNVFALSLTITTLFVVLLSLGLFFFGHYVVNYYDSPELSDWLFFIPISVFLLGVYQSLNFWNNRLKNFSNVSISKVAQSSTSIGSKLGFGYLGMGVSGLVYGETLGQSLSVAVLGAKGFPKLKRHFSSLSIERMKFLLKKYQKFPRVNLPHAFLNVFSTSSPIFILTHYFNSGIAGFYSMANKMLLLPLNIFTNSFAQVFYEKISYNVNNQDKEEVLRFFRLTLRNLLLYSGIPFIILFFVIQPLFTFVFGAAWSEAGKYASILVPMLYFRFSGTILSSTVLVFNQQEKALFLEILNTTLRIASLVIGGLTQNVLWGLILFSASSSFITIYRLFWYQSLVQRGVREV